MNDTYRMAFVAADGDESCYEVVLDGCCIEVRYHYGSGSGACRTAYVEDGVSQAEEAIREACRRARVAAVEAS